MPEEQERVQAALAVALDALRLFARDLEHEVYSAQTMRFIAQDMLAEAQRLLDGRPQELSGDE